MGSVAHLIRELKAELQAERVDGFKKQWLDEFAR